MNGFISRLWGRLTLMLRLQLVSVLILIIALTGGAYQIASSTVTRVNSDLSTEHRHLMDILVLAISPALVANVGHNGLDINGLKALIDDLSRAPALTHFSFRDTADGVIINRDISIPLRTPSWFAHWCGQNEIRGTRAIVNEGKYYGVITVGISPVPTINSAWADFMDQARILILSFGLLLLSIWWVLRRGLRPLHDLAAASNSLGQGDLTIRLPVKGSPEMRTTLAGFNQMASNIESDRKALSASEELWKFALEGAGDGVWDLDFSSKEIQFSQRWKEMLGYAENEIADQFEQWKELIHPEDLAEVQTAFQDYLEGRTPAFIIEHRLHCKDGSYKWVLARGMVVSRDTAGHPLRMVGTHADITEQKKLEEQFRQSQKLEAVGRLAGGIAHDFNNLLTVIIGYCALLQNRMDESSPQQQEVNEIRRAGERAMDLTSQLLAFSRKQILQPKVLDLNEVLSHLEMMLRRLIGEDVEINTVLEAHLGNIKADPGQIEQIVANIAVNSRDAMPDGGKLTIETSNIFLEESDIHGNHDKKPGPYIILTISDTGIGMDEKTLSQIFEPFFTTKKSGKGTGLGLSTVYGIVMQSGGFIQVNSEPGKGSTFRVCFPRTEDPKDDWSKTDEPVENLRGEETVLVAEDDKPVRELATEILRQHGYEVLPACDGEEALEIAESYDGEIGLLLTDVVMPKMGGRELYKRILQLRPDIKILYMSGHMDNAIVQEGVLDPGTTFLQKPYAPHSLARKVKEILEPEA